MRIAHVSDCYLPRTGGIETQVRSLALAQRDAGYDVQIITATPGHEQVRSGRDVVDGLPVHRIAVDLPGEVPIHPRTRAEAVRSLREDPADVLHIHAGVISPFAWGALRAARELDLPTVVTVHSVWGPLARPGFKVSGALLDWQRTVMSAVSHMAAERVESALGVDVAVLPNGIDPHMWRAATPYVMQPGTLRPVSVLRLAPRKRVGALLRALARAQALLGPQVAMRPTIIGDGPERGRSERMAQRLHLDATFTGRLSREEIQQRFAVSDVFVQASVRESFGIAALEARTFGLPVVARTPAGTGEFVTDYLNGLLAADDDALAAALARLGGEPELLARMATYNRTHEPTQTWPSVIRRAHELYERAGAR